MLDIPRDIPRDTPASTAAPCELTVLMPCLNEAETIATCIKKAKGHIDSHNIDGIVGLVVLATLGVWYMGGNIDNEPLRLVLLAMLPLTFLGVAVLASLDRMPKRWRRLPVLTERARLAVDSRRILFAPGTAVPLLLLSILSHALAAGARVLADLARQPDRATVLVREARKRGS